jgi:predicted regulator of Ras-like GTPase activity (Roadblock/LC7/MglB family)
LSFNPEKKFEMGDAMEDVLKQINTVTGALGSMVYDDQGHLLAHVFPNIFDKSLLSATVLTVSENLPGLEEMNGGVKMIDFRFQNGRIVVKPVDGGCLVLLCDGSINMQALIISLNVAIKKVEKILKSGTVAPQQISATTTAPAGRDLSPQGLIDKGPVSPYLQGMQTTLAKFLGPMAKIIFLECVERWLQDQQPVKSALPQLVDIVAAEIGDPAKISDYRQRVSTFL